MRPAPTRSALVLIAALLVLPPPRPAAASDAADEALRAVQKALGEKDPGPLADALYALRDHDGEAAAKAILSAAFRREVPDFVLDAACDALAHFGSDEAADLFLRERERARDARRFLLLEALGRMRNARVEAALVEDAGSEDPMVRTAAVRALGDRKEWSKTARGVVGRAAADPDPRVRSAAIAALSGRRAADAGLNLIERLCEERGRLFGDAWKALRRVAGRELPAKPEAWFGWWRTLPGEKEYAFETPPDPPPVSFTLPGLRSWSRRVVFVLDLSEGMADEPGYRAEDLVPADVRGAGGKELEEWLAVETRLDHARLHLARAIRSLPADASFDLVHGAENAHFLFREMAPATAENRERAVARLRGFNAKARQDFLEIVRAAMAGRPGGDPLSPEAFRDGADTVVYVGTALPSYGAELDAGRIASRVRRWNRVRQVSFLGLGVGSHGAALLTDLALTPPGGEAAAIP